MQRAFGAAQPPTAHLTGRAVKGGNAASSASSASSVDSKRDGRSRAVVLRAGDCASRQFSQPRR